MTLNREALGKGQIDSPPPRFFGFNVCCNWLKLGVATNDDVIVIHAIQCVFTAKFQVFAENWLNADINFTMDSNYCVDFTH